MSPITFPKYPPPYIFLILPLFIIISVLLNCMTKNESVEANNRKLFVKPVLQADKSLAAVIDDKPEFVGVETAYIISVTMDNINAVPNYYNAIHNRKVAFDNPHAIKSPEHNCAKHYYERKFLHLFVHGQSAFFK